AVSGQFLVETQFHQLPRCSPAQCGAALWCPQAGQTMPCVYSHSQHTPDWCQEKNSSTLPIALYGVLRTCQSSPTPVSGKVFASRTRRREST
ncbi:hypothetical protein PAXRUDRAFT_772488, partial [Paxillus rubicundulus Ve08.2h10]